MGKAYVRFMIENPEYLKFLFFTEHKSPVEVDYNKICHPSETPFDIFKKSAENYLSSINIHKDKHYIDILAMWSLVHGISLLIAHKAISFEGNYLELVDKMLNEKLI